METNTKSPAYRYPRVNSIINAPALGLLVPVPVNEDSASTISMVYFIDLSQVACVWRGLPDN